MRSVASWRKRLRSEQRSLRTGPFTTKGPDCGSRALRSAQISSTWNHGWNDGDEVRSVQSQTGFRQMAIAVYGAGWPGSFMLSATFYTHSVTCLPRHVGLPRVDGDIEV